ncbi:MAG TPA: Dam family site-specific DNA-(adenine-N6)-methyltransferase, partial [Gammaproteobacteria bacterium]|nr:Dam family site-specific DNA-(adenine-N6)-methyltransferase [Gammaproteobacteria bacterium]
MTIHVRPFLKWPGGKFRLVDKILPQLPPSKIWVEPFVGAGSVFLNVDREAAILNDINQDLIGLYQTIQREGLTFIDYAAQFFVPKNNQANRYYELRAQFNHSEDKWLRSALFLYLNRHGYNGLCRYNRKGEFNVPFGLYKHPAFPREALHLFHQKAQHVVFTCQDFRNVLQGLETDAVVYC